MARADGDVVQRPLHVELYVRGDVLPDLLQDEHLIRRGVQEASAHHVLCPGTEPLRLEGIALRTGLVAARV